MAGIFDKINAALTGHTTSGLDKAMQDHADKMHPVGAGAGVQQTNGPKIATKTLRKRADGSLILPMDSDYKP